VFRENITETFYFSVLGILALMFGSLIINVMFNLTRIAEKHNQDNVYSAKTTKKIWLIFGLSFPLIFGLLFGGDYLTSKKKEQMLISSAKSIIESDREKSENLLNYNFSKEWINETSNTLTIYSETDKHFPNITVITLDSIDNSQALLGFNSYKFINQRDTIPPHRKNYIWKTTKVEREYLAKVFLENYSEIRFSASDGRYELFYPYFKGGKVIVLYFSDRQEYGKIGS
jgi:NADH:ubiquinone oxidoreductase subunit 5 (subunit L)/multisubunit Na+/H+ antiporter MnhA subunit